MTNDEVRELTTNGEMMTARLASFGLGSFLRRWALVISHFLALLAEQNRFLFARQGEMGALKGKNRLVTAKGLDPV